MLVKSKIKYIQTLGQKKFREQEGLFIAEGPKIVKELLLTPAAKVKQVFALKEWIQENHDIAGNVETIEITGIELEKISQLTTPNKVVALVQQFDASVAVAGKGRITLVLDDLQDPGNLGSIIRIADWFGVEQIICSHYSADIYNPKVVQSTMGSIARVRVFYTDLVHWLAAQKDVPIYATTLDGQDVTAMKKIREAIIIIGNESKGIHPSLLSFAREKITIPQKGKAESLNAAVAAGIVLSHLV
jgi:RNA methyltransferase, TrmH family